MKKVKRNALIAVATLGFIVLGCFIAHKRWEYNLLKDIRETPPEKKARMIIHNHDFVLSHVRPGMTKQQVEKALGQPQNTDSEHVWAWAFPSAVPLKGDESWADLMRRGADIMSVVFLDGKVIGLQGVQGGVVMPPPNTMMMTKDCDMRTALERLCARHSL